MSFLPWRYLFRGEMKDLYRVQLWESIALAVLLVAAFLPRYYYVRQIATPPFSDMAHYDKIARSLLEGEGFSSDGKPTAYRPPAYPCFVAMVYAVFGPSPSAVRQAQAVLGALTCILVFFACRALMNRTPLSEVRLFNLELHRLSALLAAFMMAFYDEWIFFTGQMLTEIPYAFLLTLLLLGFLAADRNPDQNPKSLAIQYAGLGILSGILTLIRPVALFSSLPLVAHLLWNRFRTSRSLSPLTRPVLAFGLGLLALCLPWIVRNAIQFGPSTGLSTNTGVNLYIGHNPHFGYWSTGDKERIRALNDWTEPEENRMFLNLGLRYVLQNPGKAFVNTGMKAVYLFLEPWRPWPLEGQRWTDAWNPYSQKHVAPYKPWPWNAEGRAVPPEGFYPFPLLVWDLPFIAMVVAGLILAVYDRCRWGILYWLMGGQIAAYLVFFARARFRMPLGAALGLFAAYALTRAAAALLHRFQERAP